MTFADWKKKSKVFGTLKERAERYGIGFQEACQAAYKAGERQGRKDIEDLATRAAAPSMTRTFDEWVLSESPTEDMLRAGQEALFEALPAYTIEERERLAGEVFVAMLKVATGVKNGTD